MYRGICMRRTALPLVVVVCAVCLDASVYIAPRYMAVFVLKSRLMAPMTIAIVVVMVVDHTGVPGASSWSASPCLNIDSQGSLQMLSVPVASGV